MRRAASTGFLPSAPQHVSGRGRTRAARRPIARMMLICFGVFEMWSSPRMTCVISSHTSSMRRGEVVRRPAVGAHEDDVLELLVRELDAAADGVVPGRRRPRRACGSGSRPRPRTPCPRRRAARAISAQSLQAVELERRRRRPSRARASAATPGSAPTASCDLAARVRCSRSAAGTRRLVPREEPVEERGANVPDVQEAGRARSHADADGHAVGLLRCCSEPTVREESRRRSATGSRWAPRRSSSSCKAHGRWRFPSHDAADLEGLQGAARGSGRPVLVHALYLVNLAAPDDAIYSKSIETMRATVDAACAIRGGQGHLPRRLASRRRLRRWPRTAWCRRSGAGARPLQRTHVAPRRELGRRRRNDRALARRARC